MKTASLTGILAMIAAVGTVHAETGRVEVVPQRQQMVDDLVRAGYLLPTESPHWYQIDSDRLNAALANVESSEDAAVLATIEKLKSIVGKEVDIRSVHILEARPGTQDGGGID
jgi:hypothetical protein